VEEEACPVSGVHSNHQELTVGKIDNVHHAKDNGEAQGHQGEEETHQDSLEDRIENEHKS